MISLRVVAISFLFTPILIFGEQEGEWQEIEFGAKTFSEKTDEEIVLEEKKNYCSKRWYVEAKPGYFYFTDSLMRQFFNNGGFSIRGETGYRFWKPFGVWADGSYFEKSGRAIGSSHSLRIRLASLSLGLKILYNVNELFSMYAGAAPRLFLMILENNCDHVNDDNQIAIGGGFQAGFWVFPFPKNRNIFFDFFADYSWRNMGIDEDPNCSQTFDVNVSGLTAGIGAGFRF